MGCNYPITFFPGIRDIMGMSYRDDVSSLFQLTDLIKKMQIIRF